jgi:hypothetical protein
VRYKVSGELKAGMIGVSFSTRPDLFSSSQVEVSSAEGVEFPGGDFKIDGAVEMVLGTGGNILAISFPRGAVCASARRDARGNRVTFSLPVSGAAETEFAVDFSEFSLRQQQKVETVFAAVRKLRAAGELQKAVELGRRARLEMVAQGDARTRLEALVREMEQEGAILVREAQKVYEDFKKNFHPELLKNLEMAVERITLAFPNSDGEREARRLLKLAREEMEARRESMARERAAQLVLEGDTYRGRGMLGLAAAYYECVKDSFPGTEMEKDARARLEQTGIQMKSEGRW